MPVGPGGIEYEEIPAFARCDACDHPFGYWSGAVYHDAEARIVRAVLRRIQRRAVLLGLRGYDKVEVGDPGSAMVCECCARQSGRRRWLT